MDKQVAAQVAGLRKLADDIENTAIVYDLQASQTNFLPHWEFCSETANSCVDKYVFGRATSCRLGEDHVTVKCYRNCGNIRVFSQPSEFVVGRVEHGREVFDIDFATPMHAAGISMTLIKELVKETDNLMKWRN